MLRFGSSLTDIFVLNLRSGAPVAKLTKPLIDPHSLQIVAFWVEAKSKKEQKLILVKDIREIIGDKAIIDDLEDIVDLEDLIKLKDIIEINYQLIGKKVKTESGTSMGVVDDYSVDTNLVIKRIITRKSAIFNPISSHLSISRAQIKKVTDQHVFVDDATNKSTETASQKQAKILQSFSTADSIAEEISE